MSRNLFKRGVANQENINNNSAQLPKQPNRKLEIVKQAVWMQSRNQRKQKLASDEKNKSTNLIVSQKQIQTNIFKLATKAKSNDPNFTQSYSKPKPNLITTEQMSSLITIEENLGSGNNSLLEMKTNIKIPESRINQGVLNKKQNELLGSENIIFSEDSGINS